MTTSPIEPIDLALPEQLLENLAQYAEQESLSLDRALQITLQDFLVRQGYAIEPRKRLRITPANQERQRGGLELGQQTFQKIHHQIHSILSGCG
jgi:DNA-binding transcriptional MocR family regulator